METNIRRQLGTLKFFRYGFGSSEDLKTWKDKWKFKFFVDYLYNLRCLGRLLMVTRLILAFQKFGIVVQEEVRK